MRVATTSAQDVYASIRFDSKYFLDEGQLAYLHVHSGKWPLVTAGELLGAENFWMPNRFVRVPAASADFGKPILVPYDCFRYVPWSTQYLSRSQVSEYASAEVKRGWLLITRSGRNLGPSTLVDDFLARFTISDDMIRVSVSATEDLFYFAALLNTKTGQALVRRDRNGSVIDHLSPEQVAGLQLPLVSSELRTTVVKESARVFELREKARVTLDNLASEFLALVGLADIDDLPGSSSRSRRFSISRSSVADRFDVEPYAPRYAAYRKRIQQSGFAKEISEIAMPFKPVGRYKTLYVQDEQFGVKMLSGRQVAQFRTIGLKVMSRKAWDRPDDYLLKKDSVLLTADGRAEENLADCALVRKDRVGWAASGHVHRVIPHKNTHPGLLYLACASAPVQALLKSFATGSVIDALSSSDVGSITIPYPNNAAGNRLGDLAVEAWDMFAMASQLEEVAIDKLETELSGT